MHNYKWWSAFSSAVLLITLSTHAAVNSDRTRVVFNANEMTQSLLLSNDGNAPVLMQVWLDEGDLASSPDQNLTPVVALPPVFKMLPGEVKSLKLMLSSRQRLAADRESLYWLNLYQIPPDQAAQGGVKQEVVLPLRLRMKILVRPRDVTELREEAGKRLSFTAQGMQVLITNPTQYFISLTIRPQGQPAVGNLMLAPNDNLKVPLPKPVVVGQKIDYEVINDSGNYWAYQAQLQNGAE